MRLTGIGAVQSVGISGHLGLGAETAGGDPDERIEPMQGDHT